MSSSVRRVAAIDIGTNTVRLLAVEHVDDQVTVLKDFGEVTRLGAGVYRSGRIAPEDAEGTLVCARKCLEMARTAGVEEVEIVGTEVFRAAANGREVAGEFSRQLGHLVRVLTEDQEAEASYLGVVGWEERGEPERVLVIDLGGGSMELILGEGVSIHSARSLPIGALKITEAFLLHDPPLESELAGARTEISNAIKSLPGSSFKNFSSAVGVGGTVCATGAWVHRVVPYQALKVHGRAITAAGLDAAVSEWSGLKLEERMKMGGLSEGRARVVLGGGLILQGLVRHFALKEIKVSAQGLRHGLILRRLLLA